MQNQRNKCQLSRANNKGSAPVPTKMTEFKERSKGGGGVVDCPTQLTLIFMILHLYLSVS